MMRVTERYWQPKRLARAVFSLTAGFFFARSTAVMRGLIPLEPLLLLSVFVGSAAFGLLALFTLWRWRDAGDLLWLSGGTFYLVS